LSSGDVLETSEAGAAKFSYAGEATTLELTKDTRLKLSGDAQGKRVALDRGAVHAEVAPQPAGQPFKLLTAHGEASVLGTRFTLAAMDDFTRLDVEKGVVKLQRGNDAVNVNAGQFSLSAEGLALLTRPANATAPVNGMLVTGFSLIDASNGKVVPDFDPIPENAILSLSKLPKKLNIRVNTQPAQVGSVLPEIDGAPIRDKNKKIRNENAPPYTVFGDNYYGEFDTWSSPAPGYHMVTGTPYAGKDFTGVTGAPRTLIFKIIK
jgi:hypothetical protein